MNEDQENYTTEEEKNIKQYLSRLDIDNENEFFELIHENILSWYSYWTTNNKEYDHAITFTFAKDGQWDDKVKQLYDSKLRKPRLTINVTKDFLNKLMSINRKNTPALQVRASSVANKSQEELKTSQDNVINTEQWLRTVAYGTEATRAYQQCFKNAVSGGYAAYRVFTEYESKHSFYQCPRLKALVNPKQSFFDCNAEGFNKEDGEYSGYYYKMPVKDFKRKNPNIDVPTNWKASNQIEYGFAWGGKERGREYITICKYACKVPIKPYRIYLLSDGQRPYVALSEDERDEIIKQRKEEIENFDNLGLQDGLQPAMQQVPQLMQPIKQIDTKMVYDDYEIIEFEVIQGHILSAKKWGSEYLPYVFQDGNCYYNKDGDQVTQPLSHTGEDIQKMINYAASCLAHAMNKAQHAKNVLTKQQMGKYKKYWIDATDSSNTLVYEPQANTTPPYFKPPTEISPIFLQTFQIMIGNMQHVYGMYDSSMGGLPNNASGIGVLRAATQSILSNFEYFDNLRRAMETIGKIFLDLKDKLYDADRNIILTDKQGATRTKSLFDENNKNILKGNFEVTISAGASLSMQKQESFSAILDLFKIEPSLKTLMMDIAVEYLDIKDTPEIVKRVKENYIDKRIIAEEEGEDPDKIPPTPQQQLAVKSAQANLEFTQSETHKNISEIQLNNAKTQAEQAKVMISARDQEVKEHETMAKNEREERREQTERDTSSMDMATAIIRHTSPESVTPKPTNEG